MTSAEQQPQPRGRRKSKLSEDDMWEVSAQPPATTPPTGQTTASGAETSEPREVVAVQETAPTPPSSSRADARPRVGRGHTRDLAEARGRKRSRDAVYALAAAAARARDRGTECSAEFDAALRRGTSPDMLADYIKEACDRYGIDPQHLPTQLLRRVGLA